MGNTKAKYNYRLVPINSIHLHPKANIIPDMKAKEWDDFYLDVASRDIKVPLEITADGTILDGRHRYKAAQQLGKKHVPVIDAPLNNDNPDDYMLKAALLRRHLTDDQYSAVATLWIRENKEQGKRTDLSDLTSPPRGGEVKDKNPTTAKAVSQFKVSRKKIDGCTKLLNTKKVLFDKVHQGDLSLNDAKVVASLADDDQTKVLDLVEKGQAKNVITARRKVQRENASKIAPPKGRYQVIYADPPWQYEFGLDIHGAASRHYNTMTIGELCQFPISGIADDNAVLFLWVTSPKLEDSFQILKSWGFEYKTSFVWDKVKHVMGHYNSVRHEFLLVAVKGSYPKQSDTLHDSVLVIERQNNHSQKPREFRTLIDEMYPNANKIELWNPDKAQYEGWVLWGERT